MSWQDSRLLTWTDLDKFFHLGSLDAVWKVVEVFETTAMCQMIGTGDHILLPHNILAELIEDYEDYYANVYHGD